MEETAQDYNEVLADYQAYFLNLRKFGKLVDADLQRRPMFRFLCFILNERHQNRVILSHFGSRFDNLIVQECLLLMGFRPKTLTQGQGVLQLLPESLLDQRVHGSLHDTAEVSCVAPVTHVSTPRLPEQAQVRQAAPG